MDRRYQVFVSSTYEHLKTERQHVTRAILTLGCLPAGMELFPASDDEAWTVICRVIDESDYYVLVVSGRYGSVDSDGVSFTEREFDYAISVGKPIIAFLHEHPEQLPRDMTETDPERQRRLEGFREKLKAQRHCKFWTNPDSLETQVLAGLVHLRDTRPGTGWVRGDKVATEDALAETARLRARVTELEVALGKALLSPPPGTEDLARGQDRVVLNLSAMARDPELKWRRVRFAVETTWDEVLGVLGPWLFQESAEPKLLMELEQYFSTSLRKAGGLPPGNIARWSLDTGDFQLVKIQLLGLGIVEKSPRKHAVGDKDSYWTLTDYGRSQLLRVRAVKRSIEETGAAGADEAPAALAGSTP